jgi:ABC-type antimicrobial peptide transport system permease subunit
VAAGCGLVALITLGLPFVNWWDASPDFAVGAAAAVCGVVAALLGGWLPAWRAARVNPLVILKAE